MELIRVGEAMLETQAAEAYERALVAGAPDSVTSSFRDAVEQMRLFEGWIHQRPGFNFALHPDKSDHCKGRAIDLAGSEAKAWFRQQGVEFGWVFTDSSEDWHIAYRAARDLRIGDPAPLIRVEEDDMFNDDDRATLGRADQHATNAEANAFEAQKISARALERATAAAQDASDAERNAFEALKLVQKIAAKLEVE
jgi:hypothetical protein